MPRHLIDSGACLTYNVLPRMKRIILLLFPLFLLLGCGDKSESVSYGLSYDGQQDNTSNTAAESLFSDNTYCRHQPFPAYVVYENVSWSDATYYLQNIDNPEEFVILYFGGIPAEFGKNGRTPKFAFTEVINKSNTNSKTGGWDYSQIMELSKKFHKPIPVSEYNNDNPAFKIGAKYDADVGANKIMLHHPHGVYVDKAQRKLEARLGEEIELIYGMQNKVLILYGNIDRPITKASVKFEGDKKTLSAKQIIDVQKHISNSVPYLESAYVYVSDSKGNKLSN